MAQAPLDVNWEAVRAHAVQHGLRPTARHFGIAPGTLFARSRDENWLKPPAEPVSAVPATMQPKASKACKPYEAAQNAMQTLDGESRLYAAKAGHKLVKHFSRMPAKKLEHKTGPLKDTVVMLDKTHGWSRNGETAALVNITIGPGSAPASPVIDLEGL